MKDTMFYNYITELNINVYERLINQIETILRDKYNIYDDVKLENAVSHTIEQIITIKKKYNKDAISDKTIKKCIKFSSLKVLRLDIKSGLVEKTKDNDGKTIYTREYNVFNLEDNEDTSLTIENLSSNNSLQDFNTLDIYFMKKQIEQRFGKLTTYVFYYMMQEYKEKEIADILEVNINKVKYEKKKIKDYLEENKEKFI